MFWAYTKKSVSWTISTEPAGVVYFKNREDEARFSVNIINTGADAQPIMYAINNMSLQSAIIDSTGKPVKKTSHVLLLNSFEDTTFYYSFKHMQGKRNFAMIDIENYRPEGIKEIIKQQFAFAKVIQNGGLVPIIEPEVDIKSPSKEKCEEILKAELFEALEDIDERVIFKLTLPTKANFYEEFTKHPKLIRVVALSGGYSRHESNDLLSKNRNLIASFSRALTEGLKVDQTEPQFNEVLDDAIESIYLASTDKK